MFYKHVTKLSNERGIEFVVKYVKASRNAFLRTLSGEPLDVIDGISMIGGNPCWLLPIIKDLNDDPVRLRIFLTYLTSLRSITLKPKLDIDSIVSPYKGNIDITDRELTFVVRALKLTLSSRFRYTSSSTSYHMSTKRGPVGQAIASSISELTFLPRKLIDDIILLGGEKLGHDIENLTDRLDILQYSSVAHWWRRLFPLSAKTNIRRNPQTS